MKCIFDINGNIKTFASDANFEIQKLNFPDCDYIETDIIPSLKDFKYYRVDVTTKTVYKTKTDEEINQQIIIDKNRAIRNGLLTDTDWTQLNDIDLTEEQKSAYRIYRQELRNINLLNPVWPNKP